MITGIVVYLVEAAVVVTLVSVVGIVGLGAYIVWRVLKRKSSRGEKKE